MINKSLYLTHIIHMVNHFNKYQFKSMTDLYSRVLSELSKIDSDDILISDIESLNLQPLEMVEIKKDFNNYLLKHV